MTIKEVSAWLFYLITIMFFMNYSNPLLFWILMELSLLSFMLILNLDKDMVSKQDSVNQMIYYFIIQSSASIFFLSNFMFGDYSSIFNHDVMFLVSLIFKIGLFPLFFWVFNIYKALGYVSLSILLTFQKIPLLSALYSSSSSLLLVFLSLSFFFGSVLLFFSKEFTMAIVSSSISYSFFLYFIYYMSFTNFIIFFLIYSFFLFIIFFQKSSFDQGNSNNFIMISTFFFFLGLPPLSLFFYKFILSSEFFLILGPVECFFFWLISFLGLLGYIKVFFSSFFWNRVMYSSVKFCFQSMSYFVYATLIFFCFLV